MLICSLEIPTEIVDIFAHQLVCDDIREAWRLRGVCKTIEQAITDDILQRQHGEILRNGGEITNQLLPRYLRLRISRRHGICDILPVSGNALNLHRRKKLSEFIFFGY
jgi:hypothetical protein